MWDFHRDFFITSYMTGLCCVRKWQALWPLSHESRYRQGWRKENFTSSVPPLVRTHISWSWGGPRASRSWGVQGCRVLWVHGKHRASDRFSSLLRWLSVCAPQSRRLDTRPPGLIAQSSSICFMSSTFGNFNFKKSPCKFFLQITAQKYDIYLIELF